MTHNDIPSNYIHCFATDGQCARCGTCLRSIVARERTDDANFITCVHPRYIDKVANGQQCTFYRENKTVRMAYGFVHMFDDIPEKKAKEARMMIMQHLFTSRITYYRSRLGERPITPGLQASFASLFKKLGINEKPVFDRYEEHIDWQE